MIKIFKYILPALILFSALNYSQTENRDSAGLNTLVNPSQNIISKFEEFDFYRDLNSFYINIPINKDSNTVWQWTSFTLSKSHLGKSYCSKTPCNVSQFLYDDYIEQSKFNPVAYALGLAQAGAVGYLAYRHIKKYGFLK